MRPVVEIIISLIVTNQLIWYFAPISATTIDVKIGFLVGNQGPGRPLVHAFNYSIDKLNQKYDGRQQRSIRFVPFVVETRGNESESIRQTIGLLTKQQVNFIAGPQDTCQIEPRLASVFDVGMISHYCPLQYNWLPPSQPAATFIQTKPPPWKIVQRVVALVGQLLEAHANWYPQQLVLLYFKEPTTMTQANDGRQSALSSKAALISNQVPGGNSSSAKSSNQHPAQDTYLASDALQYKLIGESLEIKLNQLLSSSSRLSDAKENRSQRQTTGNFRTNRTTKEQLASKPLTVLNWHTTFHFGFTKNPFRQLIRRHLLLQSSSSYLNQSLPNVQYHAAEMKPSGSNQRAAIYIVVGHYYEHLGLMLALNELNLLGQQQGHQQLQSSVMQRGSVVVGVDIEQYDECDDSVRFLQGLLMGERAAGAGNVMQQQHPLPPLQQAQQSQHSSQQQSPRTSSFALESIAGMYRYYLGVVPAKPTRVAEFLDDMRTLYNQSLGHRQPASMTTSGGDKLQLGTNTVASNQTIQLTMRLLQLIRWPVEAFYLHDSMMLIGAYFEDCLLAQNCTLDQCSEGRRAFEWFRGREYRSYVDPTQVSKFDFQAQTNGLYTLITRRSTSSQKDSADGCDDEFGLVPMGRFLDTNDDSIELHADFQSIDPVWLPFWCHIKQSNSSACKNLPINSVPFDSVFISRAEKPLDAASAIAVVGLFLLTAAALYCLYVAGYLDEFLTLHQGQFLTGSGPNEGWFNERDEQNFLHIVQGLLLAPEILRNSNRLADDQQQSADCVSDFEDKCALELHCNMFPFPSCKFVHWISALHQLKELMFQFQSTIDTSKAATEERPKILSQSLAKLLNCNQQQRRQSDQFGGKRHAFFRYKHKGTASLRILLNKYKSINETLCHLNEIQHQSVVKLYGVTLSYSPSGEKLARLIVEQPSRGNLREALESLNCFLDCETRDAVNFRELVTWMSLHDLLGALEYLHNSKLEFHGELQLTSCLLTSDWRLKLSGFHAVQMRRSLGQYDQQRAKSEKLLESTCENLLYAAPEVLELQCKRRSWLASDSLRLADIYSTGFIMYELVTLREPWSCLTQVTSSKLLIERVHVDSSFRPPLSLLDDREFYGAWRSLDMDSLRRLIRSCWSQSPERRPQSIRLLRDRLKAACLPSSGWASGDNELNSADGDLKSALIIKRYTRLIERVSRSRKSDLELERSRSNELKLRLLPASIVAKLCNNQRVESKRFDCVSVCLFRFILRSHRDDNDHDVVAATANGDQPSGPIGQLNEILAQLDQLVHSYRNYLHLVDSQVDSSLRYMVYSGEPLVSEGNGHSKLTASHAYGFNHSQLVASFALQLIDLANKWQTKFNSCVQVKCGLHCGPVVGGLVSWGFSEGVSNSLARYVIHGRALQLADILESTCQAQKIQLSPEFRAQLLLRPPAAAAFSVTDKFKAMKTDSSSSIDKGDLYRFGDGSSGRQGYVMIRREARINASPFGELEAYWLLNGPRLTASQSMMLLPAVKA